jgi:hypothetical protein
MSMWRNGVVLAALPALYGLYFVVAGHVLHRGRGGGGFELIGLKARAYGLIFVAIGALLHVHFYWKSHPALRDRARAAMWGATAMGLAALAYVLWG